MRLGRQLHEGRRGEGLAGSAGEHPGGDEAQESYALVAGVNNRSQWRTSVRSKALKARSLVAEPRTSSLYGAACSDTDATAGQSQVAKRQEGNGAGDGAELHWRSKALKGQTP